MTCAGLDVGSRTIKLVTFDVSPGESIITSTGVNPLERCRELLAGRDFQRLVVTGYGRHLVAREFGAEAVSEIRAFAVGARHLFPDCSGVIDIGGQDCKTIALTAAGGVRKFEMNDRCAAGTGRFLEVMAGTLEVDIDVLAGLALEGAGGITINSLCTVFAESEVVSLIGRGEKAADIALALHEAVATRVATMAQRAGLDGKTVFAGGGSLNRCLVRLLGDKLATGLKLPDSPQTVGALGAALIAWQKEEARDGP